MSNPESQMTLEALRSVPLFASLDDTAAKDLRALLKEREVSNKTRLFRHGDKGDAMYLIESGRVRIFIQDAEKNDVTLAELAQGDFFGEMSALTGQPRTATIRAKSALACVQIEKRDLMAIFERDPSIMESVSKMVAQRNVEREAILRGGGATPEAEVVATQQKSILGRMMRFFGLGKAA